MRALTRVLIVLFQVLRAPLIVDPRTLRFTLVTTADPDKPRCPGWWR